MGTGFIYLERQRLHHTFHEVGVLFPVHLQLVVARHDDTEAVHFFGVTLGGIERGFVTLEHDLCSLQRHGAVDIQHDHVEPRLSVVFIAIAAT